VYAGRGSAVPWFVGGRVRYFCWHGEVALKERGKLVLRHSEHLFHGVALSIHADAVGLGER